MGSSTLLWALGGIGVVFGVLNVFVGIFFQRIDTWWVWGNLAVGVGFLTAAAVSNLDALRERMRSGEARRAGKYGTSALLSTALLVTILGMLGFLSTRYHERFDVTEAGVHSLTDQTRKVLEGLEEDVAVLALFPVLDDAPVRALLDRYAYVTPRFQVTYADPNERPDLVAQLSAAPGDLSRGVLEVSLGGESTQVIEVTEEKVTNALVKLSRTGVKTVYFLEGHNERGVEGESGELPEGYSRAAEALANENYRVEKLLLAARPAVPDDADVVVVAGATRPLLEPEQVALQAYLERGGALLTLIDPRANTDMVERVRSWGVDVGDDVIVDRSLALFGRATSPFAGSYAPEHDITREMRETTLFDMARSVRAGEGGPFTELVLTGDASWAERDLTRFFGDGQAELDEADVVGPVSIAVAGSLSFDAPASGEEPAAPVQARVAVFGDADFASNQMLEAYRNRDLFLNTVNWLLGDIEAISIRPQLSRASRFQMTAEQFLHLRTLSLFVLPEVLAVIGVLVWWKRRGGVA